MGKEDGSIFGRKFGRRNFIKGTAAAAAVAGVAVSSPGNTMKALAAGNGAQTAVIEEQIFTCTCRGNCSGAGCALNVHVRNGKVANITKKDYPDPMFDVMCGRGFTNIHRVYAPNRLRYPMRRAGARGEGKWEQISWDEAISEICSKWKGYQKDFGKGSIAFSGGSGSLGKDMDYVPRLPNMMGATVVQNSYDLNLLTVAPNVVGYGLYFAADDWLNMLNAKYVFIWGSNPTESGNNSVHFIRSAQEKGAKLIVIDPNFTISAAKADMFVPIRPGTDGLLAMAMTQIIVKEGLQDNEFLKQKSVAPFLVKESNGKYLRLSDLGREKAGTKEDAIVVRSADGKVGLPSEISDPVLTGSYEINGIKVTTAYDLLLVRISEWPLEKISELCDIPVAKIYELAHMYAEGPSTISTSYGPDHYANGHTAYYNMFAMSMVAGQMAKPGAGFNGANFNFCLGMGTDTSKIAMPPEATPGPSIYPPDIHDILETGKYGDKDLILKSIYFYAHNAIGNQPERKDWLKILEKMDFVVVADVIMTETADYADIILPAPHYFEVESYSVATFPYARVSEKAVEPAFESKGDLEIVNLLGAGMGMPSYFKMTREEFLTAALDNDQAKAFGLSWENLKQQKIIKDTPDGVYIHGQYGFYTPTSRAQFYLENITPMSMARVKDFDFNKERLPYWEPPHEAWAENPLYKKYPLIFTSKRAKFKVHTQFTKVQPLLEIISEPTVGINPKDAAERGIRHGDTIKVYNDRGYVVVKAVLNPGNRPGVLVIEHGWVRDQFIDGHYSDLGSRYTSSAIPANAYYDCLVEVVKL